MNRTVDVNVNAYLYGRRTFFTSAFAKSVIRVTYNVKNNGMAAASRRITVVNAAIRPAVPIYPHGSMTREAPPGVVRICTTARIRENMKTAFASPTT